jgi:peptidoglycan hydrolase CwlO-like protein
MDTIKLRENFENQLKDIDAKISKIQEELSKAQEYKLKLQGGLETLELLSKEPEEIPTPEVDVTDLEDK